jgi:adenine-specific DNA-methyltransferase
VASEHRIPWTEQRLLAAAIQLGAADVAGWSARERGLARGVAPVSARLVSELRDRIAAGADPLGSAFLELRQAAQRRKLGATYTPASIVRAMLSWAREQPDPARIVDPGVGSARFLVEAGAAFPRAELIGVELDPLAAAIARANLAANGYAKRARIILGDYREADLRSAERTLFVGNPPYVRHHLIEPKWKRWLSESARELGLAASQLAGLHVHFLLATVLAARPGDHGALITASEWLDVNYGKLLRALFLGRLGGTGIVVIEPEAAVFPDAATTAAITMFKVSSRPRRIRLRRVRELESLEDLSGGQLVRRERLETESRWSRLASPARRCPPGFVELGELCRVHRGQVTGANRIWIAGERAQGLPGKVLFRSVTRARELISAGQVLEDDGQLRSVVDLPENLSGFDPAEKRAIDRFLKSARRAGAHSGYIASHRRPWWSVGLRDPAPILSTYMARRPPVFTRNLAAARHINIAHGLYPRETLSEGQLRSLVEFLSENTSVADGRTYAGGLTKFEPGEMERLFVPGPESLALCRSRAAPPIIRPASK